MPLLRDTCRDLTREFYEHARILIGWVDGTLDGLMEPIQRPSTNDIYKLFEFAFAFAVIDFPALYLGIASLSSS